MGLGDAILGVPAMVPAEKDQNPMVKKNQTPANEPEANEAEQAPAAEPQAAGASGGNGGATKPKREAKAEHEYLDADGAVQENIEQATGIRYTDKATGEVFDWQVPGVTAGSVAAMFAVFGAKTRAINACSAARQMRKRDNTFTSSDVAYAREVFGECKDGQWTAPSEGTARGPKYDLDILSEVIVDALEAAGKTPDRATIKAKLESDMAYRRGAMQVREIADAYNAKVGKTQPTVESLMV